MRPPRRTGAVLLALAGLVLACTPPPRVPRFAEPVAAAGDGLGELANTDFQLARARPGADFGHYDALWLRYGEVGYRSPPRELTRHGRRNRGNYALADETLEQLQSDLRKAFDRALLEHGALRRADAAGEGVLEVRVRVRDLLIDKPLDASDGTDLDLAHALGALTLEVQVVDSQSGRLLALVAERRAIRSETNRPIRVRSGEALFETRRLYASWARRLRGLLAGLPALDPPHHAKR